MRRIRPTIDIAVDGHWAYISTPYNKAFIEHVKQFPGREWSRETMMWKVPIEVEEYLEYEKYYPGYERNYQAKSYAEIRKPALDTTSLYPFQVEACRQIIQQSMVGMLNFEMGLGKTPTAIRLLNSLPHMNRVLIVCPAIVRLNWRDELQKWGWDKDITIVDSGKKAEAAVRCISGALIISYELLKYCIGWEWGGIVFDESHYIKNGKTARSKAAKKVRLKNPNAVVLALTATPITSEPKDLHHQLDVLWPGRFGTFWQFANRYSNIESNGYGTTIKGTNPVHADELEKRLVSVACRVTKHEVAHLLPPFLVQTIRVRTNKRWNQRELLASLSSGVRRQHDLKTFCEEAGNEKHKKTIELVKELQESATHVCVMTHFRDSAHKLAEEFSNAFVVTGDLSPKKRMEVIKTAEKQKDAVLVCTMHSVGIGIDLTKFTAAVFAELYWQPAVIVQALGRFSRLSGRDPSTCYLLVLENSLDEPIAHALKRRLKDQAELYKSGVSEEKMLEGFEAPEDEWLAELREAATSFNEEEYL